MYRYGKALLGLSREESGVLGDGMPGGGDAEEEEEDGDGMYYSSISRIYGP